GGIMANGDVDGMGIARVAPDDGMVTHGLVLVVGGLIGRGQDVDVIAGATVKFVPLVGDLKALWEAARDRMVWVLDDEDAGLVARVRGVGDAAQKIFEPLPIGHAGPEELSAGEARGVDADPPVAGFDEPLERGLVGSGNVEGSFL